ncbi:MAG: hypothetical protein IPL39_15210 [Opitutaceae bacterium]|nr:hypothetical protein [Opitutaceae bacterium]
MTPAKFVQCAAFMVALALLTSCAPRKTAFTSGTIEGDRYRNNSIGMRMNLPAVWAYDAIPKRIFDDNCMSSRLFYAKYEPSGGDFVYASIDCLLIPDKRNMQGVANLKKVLKEGSCEGEVKVTIGQNDFAMDSLNKEAGGINFTQLGYSMHKDNYTLLFVGQFSRETEKAVFKKALETLSFSTTP